jgi:hypothetical protein
MERHKLPGTDHILSKLIQVGGNALRSTDLLIIFGIRKKKTPQQWKETIILPTYKKGDETDCSNYRGTSLLSTIYKIISNILASKLTPDIDEITGDHHCGF